MEYGEVINEADLDHDLSPIDVGGNLPQGEGNFSGEDEDINEKEDVIGREEPRQAVVGSYRVKIIEILRNLHSPEIKIYSEASKEFTGLLKGEKGGGILHEYIQLAPKCMEIEEAWRLHQGKPGMVHILSLVSVILDHPDGKSRINGLRRHLDNFARLIFNKKMSDIYAELNSQEARRQSAALNLLASIARRSGRFASEVAKSFDFKIPVLSKLSGLQKKGMKERHGFKRSTRNAFLGFAMSFIEVGNSRLLRWVLQQRELYSGVLRGLGSDEHETVIYVLSTLRNRVLVEDSLVPPALRSVLFGSTTLEQLSYISGNPSAGRAADIAHEVLVMVCTDPANGLMPGLKLKGNERRLSELMKKLKATEVGYHKDLLLAIVSKKPSLSAAYMEEFPYNLEPRSSSSWFTAISLAADVICSVNVEVAASSFANLPEHVPAMVSDELQSIIKSTMPRSCSRSLINKGLLHSDILVKNGALRLIFESLKSMENLIMKIDNARKDNLSMEKVVSFGNDVAKLHTFPGLSCFASVDKFIDNGGSCCFDHETPEKWVYLKQYIQDEVRGLLPDPQVLLKLLSLLSLKHSNKCSKRASIMPEVARKRLKADIGSVDIIISGVHTEPTNVLPIYENEAKDEATVPELEGHRYHREIVAEIWGLNKHKLVTGETVDGHNFFYSRLLDTLALFMRIVPSSFEGSFDFFKILPSNALTLPTVQQQSVLSLLVESVGQSPGSSVATRLPDFMYKHLHPLINLMIFSPSKRVRDQAYVLAKASFISTGAFDQNLSEIDAWITSLPGYNRIFNSSMESQGAEPFQCLYAVVISFLCDAVSTVGNNLYKNLDQMHEHMSNLENFQGKSTFNYLMSNLVISFLCDAVSTVGNNLYKNLNQMHEHMSNLENFQDDAPGFSPLVTCILQKCLRLLESESGTFKLYERSAISLYVSNSLKLIVQSQVDMKMLPGLIDFLLNGKFVDGSRSSLCEWWPLKKLLHFSQNLLNRQVFAMHSMMENVPDGYTSLQLIHSKINEFVDEKHAGKQDEIAFAFLSSIICASFEDILRNLHLLYSVATSNFSSYIGFFSYALFLEPNFLAEVVSIWPEMLLSCLEKNKDATGNDCIVNSEHFLGSNGSMNSTDTSLFTEIIASKESDATAFSLFLRHAPFYALFSSFVCFVSSWTNSVRMLQILHSLKIVDLLKVKISESSTGDLVLFLRCVLFWAYQMLSAYKAEPSDVLEELFQMCFDLIDCIFDHVLVDSAAAVESVNVERLPLTRDIPDVVELFLLHPLVELSLSDPICCSGSPANDMPYDSVDSLLTYSKQNYHKMDDFVLQLLTKVFKNLCLDSGYQCSIINPYFDKSILKASRHVVQKISLLFREKFDFCLERKNYRTIFPSFYIFHSIMRFFSPFDVLELANWMLSRIEVGVCVSGSELHSSVPFFLSIADCALDLLYCYLKQSNYTAERDQLYRTRDMSFNSTILQNVYYSILDFVVRFDMKIATVCLLKAFKFVYNQRALNPHPTSLPLYMLISRMAIHSPLELILCCLSPTNKAKASLLSLLMKISPLHMSLFGQIFLGILGKNSSALSVINIDGTWPLRNKVVDRNYNSCLSEDDFMFLLPAALSFFTTHRRDVKFVENIPIFYSKILLNNLSNWKSYVSGSIFQEEYPEYPVLFVDFHNYLNHSLLGKAVTMLHYFFILNGSSITKSQRLKIFDSIYPRSSELLDDDLRELNGCSYQESLKLIIQFYAKILFTRLLLSPLENLTQLLEPEAGEYNVMTHENECKRLNSAKLRIITILVNSLDQIVRIFPHKNHSSSTGCNAGSYDICSFLEHYILKNIVELTIEMKSYFDQLSSVPFLDNFIRSCLLHRFEDPVTLKAVRCFLSALSERTFSSSKILGLLLGHSQFVSTILLSDTFYHSSDLMSDESLLQPVPSVLKLINVFPPDYKSRELKAAKNCDFEEGRLELIKLLRVLYHFKYRECNIGPENVDGKNSTELVVLLLSAYGATLSETDLEILHLMHEIEIIEGSEYEKIAEMDYLWGQSILKIKKEKSLDWQSSSTMTSHDESAEDIRKMLFRENIPVDTFKCLMTVIHYCYDRSSLTASMSVGNLLQDKFVVLKEKSSEIDLASGYDPAFILRFSLHSLVMDFIEPKEFCQLGLLAISFMSISSPDEELRRLGYEVLGRFKLSLETTRRSKELLQLQLLLTYFQNGITEPWEKVPSVFSTFAAEASFILLDPRQSHFYSLSKFLMHSPNANFKTIPLFHVFFGSSTIHFKMERIWILQLICAGINLNEDAKIYKKNKLLEVLLSFHSSTMSNYQLSFLILQIVKRSVRLPVLADYLLKECGLLSWLFSIVSHFGERLHGDQEFSLRVLELVLKVVNDMVSTRLIAEWLQDSALEQLSQLASHLFKLFVNDLKLLKENISVVHLILHVIISTIRLSHKRTIYQPHFTISLEGLFKLYLSINAEFSSMDCAMINELGVMTVLMSTPAPAVFELDKARLVKLGMWAISASLPSLSSKRYPDNEFHPHFSLVHVEVQDTESLISKLLRWITASVIMGRISNKFLNTYSTFNLWRSRFENVQSLLEYIIKEEGSSREENFCANEALAVMILYLRFLLGRSCIDASVIFALCLLLLSGGSTSTGKEFLDENHVRMELLCSKIRCPLEANPSWRWMFDQPWSEVASDRTVIEQLEEEQACRSLLIIFSTALGEKQSGFPVLSYDHLETLFERERESCRPAGLNN